MVYAGNSSRRATPPPDPVEAVSNSPPDSLPAPTPILEPLSSTSPPFTSAPVEPILSSSDSVIDSANASSTPEHDVPAPAPIPAADLPVAEAPSSPLPSPTSPVATSSAYADIPYFSFESVDATQDSDAVPETPVLASLESHSESNHSGDASSSSSSSSSAGVDSHGSVPSPGGGSSNSNSSSNHGASHAHQSATAVRLQQLKRQLLAVVAPLDRGLAANKPQAREVEQLAQVMEEAALSSGGWSGSLDWIAPAAGQPAPMELLDGCWRLLYTSGFNNGSLGGTRPGPPSALFPNVLGQVYQAIDSQTAKLDNIVEFLPLVPLPWDLLGGSSLDSPSLRVTLKHDFEVRGSRTVQIVFEDTSAQFVGSRVFKDLPRFDVPQLLPEMFRPPRSMRQATFEVTYLDESLRVTRGDRGELRLYTRVAGLDLPDSDTLSSYA
ncbi:MAG: hypothetical protein WDW36_001965 [Sanguina aurantia]